ncbi:MAG TPA: gliding motility-associated peptidyl-prolyl isomerase GldI [Salinimicrobium sp.]|nr:gliding motility-associated peptidyl-prolyl isomerase GldI [Salinimicrobium sp.]
MKKIIFTLIAAITLVACKFGDQEARRPVSQKSGSFIDESIEMNKQLVAEEEEIIKKIIEKDSTEEYHASNGGFWYYYQEQDTSATKTPKFGDTVIFDYDITTLDDQVIYSEEELSTRTYVMDKEDIFSGLREGLKIMKEGETVTFLFPSHKAFGFYGDKGKIGTNIPIKSTVTLIDIKSETNQDSLNTKQ